jgi:hypothetical protein
MDAKLFIEVLPIVNSIGWTIIVYALIQAIGGAIQAAIIKA